MSGATVAVRISVVVAFLGALGVAACSSDSATPASSKPDAAASKPDAPAPLGPTFTNVYKTVIQANNCAQNQCHGSLVKAGGLDLSTKDHAYTGLVGIAAAGPCNTGAGGAPMMPGQVCGCGPTGKIRVVKGDPDTSLLVEKLSGSPDCGDRMPPNVDPIAATDLDLVRSWISAGANDD